MCFRAVFKLMAVASLSLAAFAQTSTSTVTRTNSFPPVGLATTETMQVNLLNAASASSSGTAASCTGTVSFANSSGTAIGSSTSFTIASGQVFSVSLPYSKAGLSGRGEIVASLELTFTSGTPCGLVSSLETFDSATGATHAYIHGGPGFGPGPGGPGPGGPGGR